MMNRLNELFEKLKLSVEETEVLDVGVVEAIISALQANDGEEISVKFLRSIIPLNIQITLLRLN